MVTTSYPHTEQTVDEDGWRQIGRLIQTSGVVGGAANDLEVSADGTDLTVDVAAGRAWVEAFVYDQDAVEAVVLSSADPTNDRIDLIVLRYDPAGGDPSGGAVALAVLAGTPAGSPTAPTVTNNPDGIVEVALAEVLVTAAGSTIAPGDVTDRRTYARDAVVSFTLEAYREPRTDLGDVSGAVELDLSAGQHYRINPTAAVEITWAGLPAAGFEIPGSLIVANSTFAVTWEAGTAHPAGEAPALSGETWLSFVAQPSRVVVGSTWEEVA